MKINTVGKFGFQNVISEVKWPKHFVIAHPLQSFTIPATFIENGISGRIPKHLSIKKISKLFFQFSENEYIGFSKNL